jgi:tetratricopeptide (TPR) repeat protein
MNSRLCRVLTLALFVGLSAMWAQTAAAQTSDEEPLGIDTTQPGQEVQEIPEVTDAAKLFQQRDFSGALEQLKKAAEKNKDLPPAQVILAQFFAQAKVPAGVRRSLEQAVAAAPQDPEAYVILGDWDLRQGGVTEADLLFKKTQDLLANFQGSKKRKDILEPRVHAGLAAVAEARGEWPTAQKHLENWLKLDSKNHVAMQRLARAMFQQANASGALEMLRSAKQIEPKVLTPEARLAQFYQQYGDPSNAEKWMGHALKAAPDDLRTRLVVAQWALQTGRIDEAQNHAAEAMRMDPESLDAIILRGVVALFKEDYKSAELYFENAHLKRPANFAAKNNLALALCEQDDPTKKRRALEYAQDLARQ